MLEYNRTDLSKAINVNKTDGLRECIICRHWYVLAINFKFQPEICNGCHDLKHKTTNFNDAAIASVKGNDYTSHFCIWVYMKP